MFAKRTLIGAACALLVTATVCSAGGVEEGAAGQGRYLAASGQIIPAATVSVVSYISSVDYAYPRPQEGLGVYLYGGRRQVSAAGQTEIVQVGLQAAKVPFAELPPMNLCFVIDHSGSMASADKLDWVIEAFQVFVDRVREIDYVSVVKFDDDAELVFPSTQMNGPKEKAGAMQAVRAIQPEGGTNLVDGARLGYEQVMANFDADYTNRVLFLTDGQGESTGLLEMASEYREAGVGISTIGVGQGFDQELMIDLARAGGGSSRFISDQEAMREIFGSELDRMVVPVAYDLEMELELTPRATEIETWGYSNQIDGHTIRYSLPTMHHGDYETIIARFELPSGLPPGELQLASLRLRYAEIGGSPRTSAPLAVTTTVVQDPRPVYGYSDPRVRRAHTMLFFAESLTRIAEVYFAGNQELGRINELRGELYRAAVEQNEGDAEGIEYESLSSEEINSLEEQFTARVQTAFDMTVATRKVLLNNRLLLDEQAFDDEIEILDNYIETLGGEAKLAEPELEIARADTEISPPATEETLDEQLDLFFDELALGLADAARGEGVALGISPFAHPDGRESSLADRVSTRAATRLAEVGGVSILDETQMRAALEAAQARSADLVDTQIAVAVGRLSAAEVLLTGTVMEMNDSVIIFARILDLASGRIATAAQVILSKNAEVGALLE